MRLPHEDAVAEERQAVVALARLADPFGAERRAGRRRGCRRRGRPGGQSHDGAEERRGHGPSSRAQLRANSSSSPRAIRPSSRASRVLSSARPIRGPAGMPAARRSAPPIASGVSGRWTASRNRRAAGAGTAEAAAMISSSERPLRRAPKRRSAPVRRRVRESVRGTRATRGHSAARLPPAPADRPGRTPLRRSLRPSRREGSRASRAPARLARRGLPPDRDGARRPVGTGAPGESAPSSPSVRSLRSVAARLPSSRRSRTSRRRRSAEIVSSAPASRASPSRRRVAVSTPKSRREA